MKNFIVCDIGKKHVISFCPKSREHYTISTDDFKYLDVPELCDGMTIVIEDAHLRSQEENSLAQTYKIDELKEFKKRADSRNIEILCFPQKVTPKTRKIASLEFPNLIDKTDYNDTKSISYYLEKFPHVFDSLKIFQPCTFADHEHKTEHIYNDRDALTEDANEARNNNYGIKTDYEDAIVQWLKKWTPKLTYNLPEDVKDFVGLELNKQGNALKPALLTYTSDRFKFLYGVVNTIIKPNGELRLRSDRAKLNIDEKKKVPNWKYAKKVYFGITPYHQHAGVTASNYKYHKRKAGSVCKKSMSLESKRAIQSVEDVYEIREARNDSDKKLRTLWRTIRKMIIEDGLR